MASTLASLLTAALPKSTTFHFHHLSTPPTECSPLYSPPPGQQPEQTHCESQFLSVSIANGQKAQLLQVFAIEVLVYTTSRLTTLFVSKTDSTGYLHLSSLPKGCPSPLRSITATFLRHLVGERTRWDKTLVLSLFARSQSQYLFPGSIENPEKHVLDDRGLIKWWCRVADQVILCKDLVPNRTQIELEAQGYLRVPSLDALETRAMFPANIPTQPRTADRWNVGDPLSDLAVAPGIPEYCVIPRFPDDPKARYVDTLDEELPADRLTDTFIPMATRYALAKWRSVRTLEQFWETMAYRQECSSGRLVGFLWVVFTPVGLKDLKSAEDQLGTVESRSSTGVNTDIRQRSNAISSPNSTSDLAFKSQTAQFTSALGNAGAKTSLSNSKCFTTVQPSSDDEDRWPSLSPGEIVLSQKKYEGVRDRLLEYDYSTQEAAADSSRKWITHAAEESGCQSWGIRVSGQAEVELPTGPQTSSKPGATGINEINPSLLRKRKRPTGQAPREDGLSPAEVVRNGVAAYNASMRREKAAHLNEATLPIINQKLVGINAERTISAAFDAAPSVKREKRASEDGQSAAEMTIGERVARIASSVKEMKEKEEMNSGEETQISEQ